MEPLLWIVIGLVGVGATVAFCMQMRQSFELAETIKALKEDTDLLKGKLSKGAGSA